MACEQPPISQRSGSPLPFELLACDGVRLKKAENVSLDIPLSERVYCLGPDLERRGTTTRRRLRLSDDRTGARRSASF